MLLNNSDCSHGDVDVPLTIITVHPKAVVGFKNL